MFSIGENVIEKKSGLSVQIVDTTELWGYTSYKVFNPATGEVYKINDNEIEKVSSSNCINENYIRYVAKLAKIKNETAGGFLASISNGIIPLPHQLHVLNRALENDNVRYILADEVGLGKTIEAGMIIKELKARGLVKRVLVVCPTGLVTQWAAEMQEKFNEKFQVILPSDYETIKRLTDNDDVYGQYDQVISPMDSIKPIEKHAGWTEEKVEKYNQDRIYSIINSGWDLIIIDEAHRVAGSSGEVARYKLGNLLSQASPYLLLLSATPHNGKTEPFLRLIRLLDEEAFPSSSAIVKEQVAPYLIRTEKREAIDNNGDLLFKGRVTHLVELTWGNKYSAQEQLYYLVTDYVSKTYNLARKNMKKNMCLIFLLIIMQRMVTSSTAAIKQSLERRLDALKNQNTHVSSLLESDIEGINIEDGFEDALEAMSLDNKKEIIELEQIIEVAKQAEYQNNDVKVEYLTDLIDRLISEDQKQKIIIFTEFVATQSYLANILVNRGYKVSTLNGSMSIDERNAAMLEFKRESNIFISTDAGGEGLNLQFANIIVNYDLPWNPMKIEQRCGRADRIGQKKDVHIYNFIIEDTVENRVREVLENKLAVIFEEMGVDKYSDVLDSEVAEVDFTEAYMSSIASPRNIEATIRPVEKEMKEQLKNSRKYKELIKEEKDLRTLVGSESNFDVENALHEMLEYYYSWKNISTEKVDNIGINDEEIAMLLKQPISQDTSSMIAKIAIDDFPNEAGYFMLWELAISNDEDDKRILPMFVNRDMKLRTVAGNRILDVLLDINSSVHVTGQKSLDEDIDALKKISMEYAYDKFLEMKENYLSRNEENYKKYKYALKLRREAAEKIGIENIKRGKLSRLDEEERNLLRDYESGKNVYPDFKLMMLLELEA